MLRFTLLISAASTSLLLLHLQGGSLVSQDLPKSDVDLLKLPLNLEYMETELFAWGAFGHGLYVLEPNLTSGGPPPLGAQIAKLSPWIRDIIAVCISRIWARKGNKKDSSWISPTQLDLSLESFATLMNSTFEKELDPPLDPYENDLNYLIACYVIPYVGSQDMLELIRKSNPQPPKK